MISSKEAVDPRVIDVFCPKCQHKVSEGRERLRADPHVTCPACHFVTSVDLIRLDP
jgi:ssDNA-binding Zn-finger/Zn-ribbon topoisomerase 1